MQIMIIWLKTEQANCACLSYVSDLKTFNYSCKNAWQCKSLGDTSIKNVRKNLPALKIYHSLNIIDQNGSDSVSGINAHKEKAYKGSSVEGTSSKILLQILSKIAAKFCAFDEKINLIFKFSGKGWL